ncbi:hypothetical protein SDC9_86991 [bioreactor metagenome]|uniref:Uncharacterized protein n=1 Tax=bioreactor metagenome TaxID=1076179 RepID=A0A644ZKF7_9ZZZZ
MRHRLGGDRGGEEALGGEVVHQGRGWLVPLGGQGEGDAQPGAAQLGAPVGVQRQLLHQPAALGPLPAHRVDLSGAQQMGVADEVVGRRQVAADECLDRFAALGPAVRAGVLGAQALPDGVRGEQGADPVEVGERAGHVAQVQVAGEAGRGGGDRLQSRQPGLQGGHRQAVGTSDRMVSSRPIRASMVA